MDEPLQRIGQSPKPRMWKPFLVGSTMLRETIFTLKAMLKITAIRKFAITKSGLAF